MYAPAASMLIGVSISVAAATKTPVEPPKPQFALHAIESRLLEETNRTRVRHGLPALRMDRRLMRSARRHTAWMTNRRTMQHTRAPVAENIAMGQRSVKQVVGTWMNSSGHRANMLSRRYRRIGVAAYRTPSGTIYWCQQFSR